MKIQPRNVSTGQKDRELVISVNFEGHGNLTRINKIKLLRSWSYAVGWLEVMMEFFFDVKWRKLHSGNVSEAFYKCKAENKR